MYDHSAMKKDPSQPNVMHNVYHARNERQLMAGTTSNTV